MEMLALHDNDKMIIHTDQRLCDHPDLFRVFDEEVNSAVRVMRHGDYGIEVRNASDHDVDAIKRIVAEFFIHRAAIRFIEANSAAQQLSFRIKQPCGERERTMLVEVLMTSPCGVAQVDMPEDTLLVVTLANSIFMDREPEIHRRIVDMITATLEWLESEKA